MLLHDETQTLKQRLDTGIFCDGEMKQRLIYASKDVLWYMDVLLPKSVKLQNTFTESFHGGFALLVQRLQTVLNQKLLRSPKTVDDYGLVALLKLHGRRESAAKARLKWYTGGEVASPIVCTAVPKAARPAELGKYVRFHNAYCKLFLV